MYPTTSFLCTCIASTHWHIRVCIYIRKAIGRLLYVAGTTETLENLTHSSYTASVADNTPLTKTPPPPHRVTKTMTNTPIPPHPGANSSKKHRPPLPRVTKTMTNTPLPPLTRVTKKSPTQVRTVHLSNWASSLSWREVWRSWRSSMR